ncbi:hypothetical protein Dda_6648 [Drechslerella dactyloides]|uniref:Rhodanese domain-containing protein n=1 Tax=Drechslerella dactyloides TaxID=74499 RepID=A0AAD6IXU1_DREDA|nr:hypothetical protein Dda_6648 [Drechslerella dactyloides]
MEASTTAAPWYSAYPAPKSSEPNKVTREEVLELLRSTENLDAKDFVLIDVRRNDYEGGSIHGSINIPAQSLYNAIPIWYNLFKAAGVKRVIWFCGSSGGRGTRSSLWFQEYLDSKNETEMKSMIMVGGIKGWAVAGSEYVHSLTMKDE